MKQFCSTYVSEWSTDRNILLSRNVYVAEMSGNPLQQRITIYSCYTDVTLSNADVETDSWMRAIEQAKSGHDFTNTKGKDLLQSVAFNCSFVQPSPQQVQAIGCSNQLQRLLHHVLTPLHASHHQHAFV